MNPDFFSIRTGISYVLECDGMAIMDNLDHSTAKKLCMDFISIYPFNVHQLKYFHTGFFMNMMLSFCKPLLPRGLTNKIQIGCVYPGGRLDSFYLLPDLETATERTITRMQESMRRRYAMEARFTGKL
ncbi:expressed unknown protein [Seminavis robusta]|uniref:CRAL-TRIO domain-containing protein n=1 Tax=Seminavis robusta TaxID=568900 RepID=A0A9N8DRQ6_9STRA|nr:expressed unknown protein [Seminavis robusta]|eukprot:Sro241_g096370.1 n/a (128) ;mRNA; f:49516-49899